MMDKPLYNSIIIKNYLDYLKSHYPDVNLSELLNYAGIAEYEAEDRGHWLTQPQINRFHEYLDRIIKHPDFSREVGRFVASGKSSVNKVLQEAMSGFLSPSMAYWALEKIAANLTRHQTFHGHSIGKNKFEIFVTSVPGVKEELFQCSNRLGLYEAVGKFLTGKYATIEHPECQHQGAAHCRYIITWESPKSFLLTQIGSFMLAATVLVSFLLLYFLPIEQWLITFLGSLLVSVCVLFVGSVKRNHEIAVNVAVQEKTSQEMWAQINLRYDESMLIREISEAEEYLLDPRELSRFIMDILHQRLKYERSIVMLTNPEKTKLVCTAVHGFTPHEEALLSKTSLRLTRLDPQGNTYRIFNDQKPVVVDAGQPSTPPVSDVIQELTRELGAKSFIAIPIIYKKATEGILAVDTSKREIKPMHSDINVLMGIAGQIGICLSYARAQKNAQENKKRLQNLSENASDIIYQLDPEGKIKYVNAAWNILFGHQTTDLIHKNLTDFMKQEDRQAFDAAFEKIIRNKSKLQDQHFTIFNTRGLPRQILFSGMPDVDADGHVIGIIGIIKDISKLRSMEAQLIQASKREVTNTLTKGMIQDFNHIIRAVMGYRQLNLQGATGKASGMLNRSSMDEFISSARELVHQLILYTKNVSPVSPKSNLNEVITRTIPMISKAVSQRITIKMDLDEKLPPVIADPTQIGQVILNLVMNASDAMQENGIITVKTGILTLREKSVVCGIIIPAGTYAQISVADTGCGMEEKLMKRIYEPFFTTKEEGKGTGLGLAVVYSIMKKHNGYIYCESKPDEGATFYLMIPALES